MKFNKNLKYILIIIIFCSCQRRPAGDSPVRKRTTRVRPRINKPLPVKVSPPKIESKPEKIQDLPQREIPIESSSLANLYNQRKKGVLRIYVPEKFSNKSKSGTAFMIDDEGTCVSNYHVFNGKNNSAYLIDYQDNRHQVVNVRRANAESDYVIFQISSPNSVVALPISANEPDIGAKCFAIGNPLGMDFTLSDGIISSYRENRKLIQTTTDIEHGSSGGPLFNMNGEVIGVTTSSVSFNGNLNFAVNIKHILKN